MASERRIKLEYPERTREPGRRWGTALRTGVIGIVAALASASPAAAMPPFGPGVERVGPYVSAASFSGGQLNETVTFHKAGTFAAHIVPNPLFGPGGSGLIGYKTVALGHHAAGKARITLRLGTLKPGLYAVVILPQPQIYGPTKAPATWVYLRVHTNGRIVVIRLIHP